MSGFTRFASGVVAGVAWAAAATTAAANGASPPRPHGQVLGGLDAVDAGPGGQAWGVGFSGVEPYRTYAQRWDGDAWTHVSTPAPNGDSELVEVAAVGPNDAWAVGYVSGPDGNLALILHWDGSRWRRVPSHVPQSDDVESQLLDVDGSSPSNVWAVGTVTSEIDGSSRTLIMHWNGARWVRVPSADLPGYSNVLVGVHARAADDVWAVGYGPGHKGVRPGLAEHWDGRAWKAVPVQVPAGKSRTILNAVTSLTASQALAVGRVDYAHGSKTIVEKWNGRRWSIIAAPSPPGGGGSGLNGVTAADGAPWAVGGAGSTTLALRNAGSGWERVASPGFPPSSLFTAAYAISPDDVWAVGFHGLDQVRVALLSEHWDGTQWVTVQH
jgi:hypothetical protein